MPCDRRVLELMSYYREAELHGAGLLLRLMRMMANDPDAQIKLTRHVAEETRHAWLWTKRIAEMGEAPLTIANGYQTRIGMRVMPRSATDLLALTIVAEERSLARYREHAARPDVDQAMRKVLEAVAHDEEWHISWMKQKLEERIGNDPTVHQRIEIVTKRYREIDRDVYAELRAREREAFGETLSDPREDADSATEMMGVLTARRDRTVA